MFWNILRLESQKTFHRALFWGCIILLALFLILCSVLFFLFQGTLPRWLLVWPGSLIYALNNAVGFTSWSSYGTYVLIILTGVITAQEYSWRTIQLWTSHGVSRTMFLGARFLLIILCALTIVLACLLAVGGITIVLSLVANGLVSTQNLDIAQLLLSLLRTTYSMLPYAALTILLAVASRSAVVAVGGGLAFIAIGETILNTLLPLFGHPYAVLAQFLPANLAISLNSANYALAKLPTPHTPLQPDLVLTILSIALYTLLFGALALIIFRRQDLAR
jgi:ABC-type transport system involved in multi-copper enzyme maturation permease subunit